MRVRTISMRLALYRCGFALYRCGFALNQCRFVGLGGWFLHYQYLKSHVLPDFAVELLHFDLELGLQTGNMFLVLENLLPQLVPLIHNRLVILLQLLVVPLVPLSTQILPDFVGEVFVEIFGHLELLFHNLKLVFQRFVEVFVFEAFGFEAAVAVGVGVVFVDGAGAGFVEVAQQRADAHIGHADVVVAIIMHRLAGVVQGKLLKGIALEGPLLEFFVVDLTI